MKSLVDTLMEKLDINKVSLEDSLWADQFRNYQEAIKALKELAKNHKLEIKFRDKPMPSGDFCIFIYNKSKQQRYLVGFDGDWQSLTNNFARCYQDAVEFIENYKR